MDGRTHSSTESHQRNYEITDREEELLDHASGEDTSFYNSKSLSEKNILPRQLTTPEAKGFFQKMKEYRDHGQTISSDDIVKFFLLWEEDEEELQKQLHEMEHSSHPKHEHEKSWLKKHLMIGQGPESWSWESAYGHLIEERVEEIAIANLNARDRKVMYKHALSEGDLFEARALLFSMAMTSDFVEDWMEDYYREFGELKEVKVYDDKGTQAVDEHGKPKTTMAYTGGWDDFWFETKMRRAMHGKAHRPDVWHSGRREVIPRHDGEQPEVVIKSEKWIAKETDDDALLTPGRKGDTASETVGYATLGDEEAKAAELLLAKKVDKMRLTIDGEKAKCKVLIDQLTAEKEKLESGIAAGGEDFVRDTAALEKGKRQKERELSDAKSNLEDMTKQLELMERRLQIGYQPGDVKSMFFNIFEDDLVQEAEKVVVNGNEYRECQLALSHGSSYMRWNIVAILSTSMKNPG